MDKQLRQDLIKLISYVYRDERDDYESYEDDGIIQDNHIFVTILAIMNSLNIKPTDLEA